MNELINELYEQATKLRKLPNDEGNWLANGLESAAQIAKTFTAKWKIKNEDDKITVTCSNCNYHVNYFWGDWELTKYCPNCGRRIIKRTYEKN